MKLPLSLPHLRSVVLLLAVATGCSRAQSLAVEPVVEPPEQQAEERPTSTDDLAELKRQLDRIGDPRTKQFALAYKRLLADLEGRPSNDPLVVAAVAMARRHAAPVVLDFGGHAWWDHTVNRFNQQRLGMAWSILRTTGTLKPGMGVTTALEILGPPAHQYVDGDGRLWIRIAYRSPMHVNPALDLLIVDERVVEFRDVLY